MVLRRALELWEKYLPGSRRTLIYVHIGKCGGASLNAAIEKSGRLKNEFRYINRIHVRKPPYLIGARYLIVIRNPISRALSAFNWRYRLVIEEGSQVTRFPGESEILMKYGTLNNLAESLFQNGDLDEMVAEEFRSIHHLNEDVSFCLSDLIEELESDQVFAVLTQEYLDDDIEKYLGVKNSNRFHSNREKTKPERLFLSDLAKSNLSNFLESNYEVIRRLNEISPIGAARLEHLIG